MQSIIIIFQLCIRPLTMATWKSYGFCSGFCLRLVLTNMKSILMGEQLGIWHRRTIIKKSRSFCERGKQICFPGSPQQLYPLRRAHLQLDQLDPCQMALRELLSQVGLERCLRCCQTSKKGGLLCCVVKVQCMFRYRIWHGVLQVVCLWWCTISLDAFKVLQMAGNK